MKAESCPPQVTTGGPVNSTCPRCQQAFHCGVIDAAPCPCSALALTDALRRRLAERYATCLCVACLRELASP